jgi:hypothetical protein
MELGWHCQIGLQQLLPLLFMPKSKLTIFATCIICSNTDALPSFFAPPGISPMGNSTHWHQSQEPFESIMHIDIPPPAAPQAKAPTILLPQLSQHA